VAARFELADDGLADWIDSLRAEHDPLRDEGDAYATRLAEAGVAVLHRREAGLVHGFLHLDLVAPAAAAAGERFFAAAQRLLTRAPHP
jgi:acetyl esterase